MRQAIVTESPDPVTIRARLPRRLTAFIVLLLALAAGNLLYARLDQARPPIVGGAGELLYLASFDGFLDEWDLHGGQQRASIVDSRLRLELASAQTEFWSLAPYQFVEFDLSLEAQAVAGPIDNAFGVVFAMHKPADATCDLPALIFCALGQGSALLNAALRQVFAVARAPSYYAFLISSDGYYSLERVDGGAREQISAWIPAPNIELGLGAGNRIRVLARGTQLKFFVNGELMPLCLADAPGASSTYAAGDCIGGSITDIFQAPAAPLGQLGLIAQATQTGGGGVVVEFDNFIVFSPSAADREEVEL